MMSNLLYKIRRKHIRTSVTTLFPLFIFTAFCFGGNVYASTLASCKQKGQQEIILICNYSKAIWAPKNGYFWQAKQMRGYNPKPGTYTKCSKDTPVIDNIHFSTNPRPSLDKINKTTSWLCEVTK